MGMPNIARMYFITAVCFLIAGILVGLKMSIAHDYAAVGAHAHINLLGWVTMALFGTFHALNPRGAATRLAKIQYYVYTLGVLVMTPALYFLLTGNPSLEPIVAVSSLVVFAGVLMFAAIIFRTRAG
jgi:NADH:ubiquinone oxidoreductase subunit 3 (subunit A)